jgi:neutral ceramidase
MLRTVLVLALLCCPAVVVIAEDTPWKAGIARVNINPELPIWLSGYGGRNHPANEKLDDLWAKALVLEDGQGTRGVLVTMDLVGIDRNLSLEVCRRIEEQYKLPRASIALCTSHTHSGPVIRGNLVPMYDLNDDQAGRVQAYAVQLADKLVAVVGDAINSLAPSRLSYATGIATFAVNRRNNPEGKVPQLRADQALVGPVDHDVPVLAFHGADGKLRAVVAGYACHATVLDTYKISGDWPGVAQNEIERRHPGTIALYWAGCGADQNPLPRRTIDLLNQHGREFADVVDSTLRAPFTPIPAILKTTYEEIDLPFAPLPSRAELELEAAKQPPQSRWAKYLLTVWDQGGGLSETYPYPVQAWQLGPDITWLFLGGEVVVDYALRLKSDLGPKTTWVASYSNDVMGYIPSRRVLAEGGYEGGLARFPYGLPAVWDPKIEQQIIDAAHKVAKQK